MLTVGWVRRGTREGTRLYRRMSESVQSDRTKAILKACPFRLEAFTPADLDQTTDKTNFMTRLFSSRQIQIPNKEIMEPVFQELIDGSTNGSFNEAKLVGNVEIEYLLRLREFSNTCRELGYQIKRAPGVKQNNLPWEVGFFRKYRMEGLFLPRVLNFPESAYQRVEKGRKILYRSVESKSKELIPDLEQLRSHLKASRLGSLEKPFLQMMLGEVGKPSDKLEHTDPLSLLQMLDVDVLIVGAVLQIPLVLVPRDAKGETIDFSQPRIVPLRFEQVVMPYPTNTFLRGIDYVL